VKALTTGTEGVDAGAVRLRREIHALPETAFEEVETAGLVAARMMAGGVTADVRTMGGEDFSEFLLRVPGAFAFVGAARSGAPRRPHHAPDFDFDERALPHAARLLAGFARDVLAS
jgi:metal-dependent amidase/aminoacylase/carboxypeptidase family protein